MYWLSARGPTDLFLLYCFTDTGRPARELREFLAERSTRIPELSQRLRRTPADLHRPRWISAEFSPAQYRERTVDTWHAVPDVLGSLLGTRVEAAEHPWVLHVLRGVTGAPGVTDAPALLAVLQVSHALADGRAAARIARELFGSAGAAEAAATSGGAGRPVAARFRSAGTRARAARGGLASAFGVAGGRGGAAGSAATATSDVVRAAAGLALFPWQLGATVVRGFAAARAQRELAARTAAGRIPPPGPGFPPGPLNPAAIPAAHTARLLVLAAADLRLPGRTVTVAALTAISVALTRYLTGHGHPPDALGAQVPAAVPGTAGGNNYRSPGVDLHVTEPDLRARSALIAADLAARRTRATHPLLRAQDRVTAVVPAVLLRRDVERYPLDAVPAEIAGHTVVSSVHRGPADLTFGGGPVHWTGGFPALGSVMHLTHGVHGLGDTVTLSVHADPAVVPDLQHYLALLAAAVTEVRAAHSR